MKTLAGIFAVLGLLATGYWTVGFLSPRVYQAREIRRFVNGPRVEPFTIEPAKPSHPELGSPIAVLTIPRLGLSTVVLEGAEERELKLGPGHIRGTSLPGEGGNVGVAGHRDTVFRPLRLIRRGDRINIVTHERELQYQIVSAQIVEPEDVQVLYPTARETLTLVTCYPFDFVGPAPNRFIVRAEIMPLPNRE